jgi:hypothetical protein
MNSLDGLKQEVKECRVRQPLNFRVAHAFGFEAWGFSALSFAFRIVMSSNQPLIILLIAIR